MEEVVQLMHTWWRGCKLHLDMMEDLERQCSHTWRIMSTCTTQFRWGPRHGEAHKIYKGDEHNNEGRLLNIEFEVYLDLEFPCDIPCFLGLFKKYWKCCLAHGVPGRESLLFHWVISWKRVILHSTLGIGAIYHFHHPQNIYLQGLHNFWRSFWKVEVVFNISAGESV